MQQTNTSKISTWIFKTPLKFAIYTFCTFAIIGLLYILIIGTMYAPNPLPIRPLFYLTFIVLIYCTYKLYKHLPPTPPNQTSFVATHNAQILITSIAFFLISIFIFQNENTLALKLSSSAYILTVATSSIICLYLIGIIFSNIFLKFMRIQTFKIPTWKIIFSMPFGFSALWTPGYILKAKESETDTITIKSNWYKKLTKKILSHQSTTIAVYALITMLSGFIFGIRSVLLTFILALIFGIWAISVGTKKFIKNAPNKYATYAIIINIVVLTILSIGTQISQRTPTTINISETTETINL